MKEMKENERSGKSDHPINLSTMLSSVDHHLKRHSDSSLSPRSPQGHYGGHDDDDEDIDDMDDEERDDGVDSSVVRRSRHSSGDIRAQFMADLRRLGGNIPRYNNHHSGGGGGGGSGDEPASSTTVSPPPMRLPHPPPLLQLPTSEDSLPPRKRKVSQEHHDHASSSSPYNGTTNGGGGGNGNESESSAVSSPEKQSRRKDGPMASPSLPCRNWSSSSSKTKTKRNKKIRKKICGVQNEIPVWSFVSFSFREKKEKLGNNFYCRFLYLVQVKLVSLYNCVRTTLIERPTVKKYSIHLWGISPKFFPLNCSSYVTRRLIFFQTWKKRKTFYNPK